MMAGIAPAIHILDFIRPRHRLGVGGLTRRARDGSAMRTRWNRTASGASRYSAIVGTKQNDSTQGRPVLPHGLDGATQIVLA